MKSLTYSMVALMMSTGFVAAQGSLQSPGAEPGGGGGRQQERSLERMERREQRQEMGGGRQEQQDGRAMRRGGDDGASSTVRVERDRGDRGDRQGGGFGSTVRVERDRGDRGGDRFEDRSRERVDRRVIVRDRGPDIRFGVGPSVYIRTLPLQYRTVIYGGRPCRITITRRVRANGRIVTTETRKCPGRPAVVIRRR